MTITAKRLKELERAEAKLYALEAGGVDNWDNYDDALEEYRNTIELEEKKEALLDELEVVFAECAYEPCDSSDPEIRCTCRQLAVGNAGGYPKGCPVHRPGG